MKIITIEDLRNLFDDCWFYVQDYYDEEKVYWDERKNFVNGSINDILKERVFECTAYENESAQTIIYCYIRKEED